MKRILLFFVFLLLNTGYVFCFEPARYSVEIFVSVQGDATCGNVNHYKINFYNSMNNSVLKDFEYNLGRGDHVRTNRHSWEYPVTQSISYNIEGRRRRNSWTGCVNATNDAPTPITAINMTGVATRSIQKGVPNWGGKGVTICVFPKLIEIESTIPGYDQPPPGQTGRNNAFPIEDSIRISVTPGFPSIVYKWQYSVNGGVSWVDMSRSYNGKTSIDVCGKDLFGDQALEYVSKYKNIYFRIKPPEVGTYKTNSKIIVLDMVPSAPYIKKLENQSPKCFDSLDGSITVFLSRKLIPGEELLFFVDSDLHNNIVFNESSDSAILLDLSPKKYEIRLLGYYEAGNYRHTTYSGGQKHKEETTITAPSQVNFEVANNGITHVLCYGNNTGSIQVNASGGTAPYTLLWKRKGATAYSNLGPFAATAKLPNLNAAEYEFYVKDSNGCFLKENNGDPLTRKVTINQPGAGIEITTHRTKSPSGYGLSNGSITVEVTGGMPGSGGMYTCAWTNKETGTVVYPSNEVVNGKFRSTIDDIPAGVYTVVVQDQSGCDRTADINLTQPALFTAAISVTKAITCNGDSDGTLYVASQGGVGSVSSYKWYKKENGSFVSLNQYSQSISQLATGEYRAELEDGSIPVNKTAVNFFLAEPAVVAVDNYQIQDVTCYGENNGRITITAKGGNLGYKLKYRNKDSVNYTTVSAVGNSPTIIVNGLAKGEYLFQLYDRNNCYASFADGELKLTVNQPEKAVTITPHGMKNISGYGRSDGALSYRIEGGTPEATSPEYNVVWKDSLNNPVPHTEKIENGVFITAINDVPQGKYTLEVTDKYYQSIKNGCYAVAVGVLNEPDPLTVDLINLATIDCHGDSSGVLVARVNGGVPFMGQDLFYDFKWYQVVNGTDSLLVEQTDSILPGLGAGHYKVFIEDSSMPANSVESSIFHVEQPPLLVTQLTSGNISCFGSNDGFIHIQVSGGVGGYRMFYKNTDVDSVYSEQAIDVNNTTFYADSLFSGLYSVYILDGNSCYASINGDDVYEIALTQPDEPLHISDSTVRNQSGYGIANGSIRIQIEGGTPRSDNSYSVVWKDGNGNTIQEKASFSGGKYISVIDSLEKGDYIVVIKDDNYTSAYPGKEATCFLTDTFTISEPKEFRVRLEESHFVTCNGMDDGELIAYVSGGIVNPDSTALPYRYAWYEEINGKYEILEADSLTRLHSLKAGNYRLIVEDYSWQTNRVVVDHALKQPDKLIVTADDVSVMCGTFAVIQAVVTGGTPPYNYEWNTGDTTAVVTDAVSGKYLVFVTDSRGCEASTIARVTAPSDMYVDGKIHHPACRGAANGSIELKVTGGEAPYMYKWSTGATTPVLNAIPAGAYSVIVSDQSGCSFFQSFTLEDPEAISVYIGEDRVLCAGQQHEIIPVYEDSRSTCYWTGPSGFTSKEKQIRVKQPGTYKLTITDSKGCQATDEIKIMTDNEKISAEFVVSSQVFAEDTIVFVNISNPYPERVEWLIPETDSLEVVERTDDLVQIIFKETGFYTVGMRTFSGDCYEENMKSITVLSPENKEYTLRESGIKSFIVSPNPNNGVFNVFVELNRVYNIRIRIVSIGSGAILHDERYYGSAVYSLPYNIGLAAGAYVVLLETEVGQKILKMIVK